MSKSGDWGGIFKQNGERIKNPAGFVSRIEHYEGGLFTSDGKEIQNIHAFVANMDLNQSSTKGSSKGKPARGGGGKGGDGGGGLFRSDGSEVRNPAAFVANIEHYDGGLFTASGKEIWNPQAFVANMDTAGKDSWSQGSWKASGGGIFKEDGTEFSYPVRRKAFVANIQNYEGGLYTADGQEIRNPQGFVAKMEGATGAGKGKGYSTGKGKGSGGLFRADGTEVRNPAAFVSKIENYDGGLFTAAGAEIWNIHGFVAKMEDEGIRRWC